MKKLFILLLFIPAICHAAPPSRVATYTPNTTISSTDVTSNEDAIFNYLQGGVDTIADGTVVNDDVNSSANIQSDKLNLTSIAQNVAITSSGSFTNAGTLTQTGNATFSGITIADLGTITTADINGGTIDGVTIGGASAPTVTDLGSVATADINGGTMDGVQIGGTTATGELIVNDASDDADGLGSQGTSGQFLQSAGSGSNPTWANAGVGSVTATTWSAATTSGNITLSANKVYLLTFRFTIDGSTDSAITIAFDGTSVSHSYAIDGYELTTGETDAAAISQASIPLGTADAASGKKVVIGQLYIFTTEADGDQVAQITGTYGRWGNSALPSTGNLWASVYTTDAVSTFSIDSAQNMTGAAYLYSMGLN